MLNTVVPCALAFGAFCFLAGDEDSSQGLEPFYNIAVTPAALTPGLTGGEFGGERVEAAMVQGLRVKFTF